MNERDIFMEALKRGDGPARREYLDSVCAGDMERRARVESLFHAHERQDRFLLDSPPSLFAATVAQLSISEQPGMAIGRYKLLEQIGEGGFGVVFMAEQQEPIRRKVALKIIKPGMDTNEVIARFEAERQALALMDHPNIAKVLDAGATASGRPFFAMELVRGTSITQYCDSRKLSARARLELFDAVCSAVQHAHQKGIIHRDIKPSNVMVTMRDDVAVPKVIDFGVAKATNQRLTERTLFTRYAQMLGTPLYMSPEQAQMNELDVDTRSDIYSLGVLLYEILTGTTPFDRERLRTVAYDELLRIIREEEPPRPSTRISALGDAAIAVCARRQTDPRHFDQILRGDLDWIVMKALEKDRTRRYESANGFAVDIRHYLAHETVSARPPSAAYRFRKFARRNQALIGTLGIIGMVLIAASGFSTWQAIRATRAETVAELNLVKAERARRRAEDERERADHQREIAVQRDAEKTRQLYVSQMNLAQRAWKEKNVGRARELLKGQRAEHTGGVDLRGWEWHYLRRLSHSEFRKLEFKAMCLAYTPDGRLVSGSEDGTLKTWSANETREISAIKAHNGRVHRLAISNEGQLIATRGGDNLVKLWDTSSGKERYAFPVARGRGGLAFSPDAALLAAATANDIAVWNTATGMKAQQLEGHDSSVEGLAFFPDGSRLVSCSRDGAVLVWDVESVRQHLAINAHKSFLRAVAVSPDGRMIAAGGEDGVIKCWDASTGRELFELMGHSNQITWLDYSSDGKRLLSSSNDTTVRIWDADTGEALQELRGHETTVNGAVFAPEGDVIASGSWDGTIRLWDVASRQEPWLLSHSGNVSSVDYSPDGSLLAVGGGHTVTVFDSSTGVKRWHESESLTTAGVVGSPEAPRSLSFDSHSQMLVLALRDGRIRFRDARTGRVVTTNDAHKGPATTVDFSPDGRILATGGFDRKVMLWSAYGARRLAVLHGHTDAVTSVSFSPDGTLLASTGHQGDKTIRLWDVATRRELRALEGHEDSIACVVFSHDGSRVFSGGRDEMIRTWDVRSGRLIRTARGHAGSIECLALSTDGQRLVSCSNDYTVRLWDVTTGQQLQTLAARFGGIKSVDVSPDGYQLAAGTWGQKVIVWDARPLTAKLRSELASPELRDRFAAEDLVESLFTTTRLKTDVLAALNADTTISEGVRRQAMDLAEQWRVNAGTLNHESWSIVKQPGLAMEQYDLALRYAQAACEMLPNSGIYLNTLGVAQYRAGHHADAAETLSRSDAINATNPGGSVPFDIAFLAMSHQALGNTDEARRFLEQLRQLLETDRWKADAECRAFMQEVEDFIHADSAKPESNQP